MTYHYAKNQTAGDILPTIPAGKELRETAQLEKTMRLTIGNLKSFVLLNQRPRSVEVREMTLQDKDKWGDSDRKLMPHISQ